MCICTVLEVVETQEKGLKTANSRSTSPLCVISTTRLKLSAHEHERVRRLACELASLEGARRNPQRGRRLDVSVLWDSQWQRRRRTEGSGRRVLNRARGHGASWNVRGLAPHTDTRAVGARQPFTRTANGHDGWTGTGTSKPEGFAAGGVDVEMGRGRHNVERTSRIRRGLCHGCTREVAHWGRR